MIHEKIVYFFAAVKNSLKNVFAIKCINRGNLKIGHTIDTMTIFTYEI